MRSLALGRYRFLTTNRAAGWILGVSILGALFAAMIVSATEAMNTFEFSLLDSGSRRADHARLISLGGQMLVLCYVAHCLLLCAACHAFASRDRRSDAAGESDLMDTAPVSPSARFWGDAMGVFASTMAVHLATLPLIAFIFAVSPFPTASILWAELFVVTLVVLESAAASWKLHTSRGRSATARTAASIAIMLIMIILTVWASTSWRHFLDALGVFLVWPSPPAWAGIVATIYSPLLLVIVLLMIHAGFTLFYYFRTVRAVEQG